MRGVLHLNKSIPRMAQQQSSTRKYATRTYGEALDALNSLQSNASFVTAILQSGRGMNKQAIPEMLEWLRRAGYKAEEFNAINAIHIAGTKGKGSTGAFVSSILNQYRLDGTIGRVGLYTSPHLRFVRERIQIDGEPLSEADFTESLFEIWDRLEKAQIDDPVPENTPLKPLYFRFLTIMAFHTYLNEKVDAAVVECGIGGITSLGIDHVHVLGSTLPEIAWHKAGIMKSGVPIFTVPQPQEAMQALADRAKEKDLALQVIEVHPEIANGQAALGLNGEFQKLNASLAVELAASYLRHRGVDVQTTTLPEEFRRGLEQVHWPGRCETRKEKNLMWCIDGAHTKESMQATSQWYSSLEEHKNGGISKNCPRILLFNQQSRDGLPLLQVLHDVVSSATSQERPFTHAIFCTNVTYTSTGYRPDLVNMNADESIVKDLQVQKELADGWKQMASVADPGRISVLPTIEEAVKKCRQIAYDWQQQALQDNLQGFPIVLATGSIHLIGGVMDVLEEVPP